MFSWKSKTMNPLSLMTLCSQLAGMKDIDSQETQTVQKIIRNSLKRLKNRIKIAYCNSLIRMNLQSEKSALSYLKLVLELLSETIGLEKIYILSAQEGTHKATEINVNTDVSELQLDPKTLKDNFEPALNFLKLHIFASDSQSALLKLLNLNPKILRSNVVHIHTQIWKKTKPKIDLLGFFITKSNINL